MLRAILEKNSRLYGFYATRASVVLRIACAKMSSSQKAPAYRSRRANAAAAADASVMHKINEHSTRKKRTAKEKDGSAIGGTGRITKPPRLVQPPQPRDNQGRLALLQARGKIDADEIYGEQEKALSEFLKLHPMLSLESSTVETMQLMANLIDEASIPSRELEVVGKAHDDSYLRPPDLSLGERPCCLGNRCLCLWLARWRYGEQTDLAFIGAEFLLPSELVAFQANNTLPATPGKCLVCSRYYHTYLYRLARSDPTFCPSAEIQLQAYGNLLGSTHGESVPTHASVACDSDGYRQEALLFVDEQWADTHAARESGMNAFLWRPCVKFVSNHYVYVRDPTTTLPRLVQQGVGVAPDEDIAQHFYQPASPAGTTALAFPPPSPPNNPPDHPPPPPDHHHHRPDSRGSSSRGSSSPPPFLPASP